MPLIIPTNSISAVGYDVDNSLRFDTSSSDYLSRTPASSGSLTTWTYSCWVKRLKTDDDAYLIWANDSGTTDNDTIIINSSNVIYWNIKNSNSSVGRLVTNQVFRDTSAWYHLVFVWDTTNATSGDRMRVYVNGERVTSFSTENQPSQNATSSSLNANKLHLINEANYGGSYQNVQTDLYLAEVVFCDGQALDQTSFGEFDEDSGIWKPIDVSGLTFGTNGFYLDFENSGSLGADVSGNGNNFTVNNLTSIDQTTDTCTNNFATLNGAFHKPNHTLANGNLDFANSGSTWYYCPATIGASSGKWYCEIKVGTNNEEFFGVVDMEYAVAQAVNSFTYIGVGNGSVGYQIGNGQIAVESGSTSAFGNSLAVGDILQIALDMDNEYVYFGKNGTWQNSGDPTSGSSGTGGQALPHSGATYTFGVSAKLNGQGKCNFGNPFETISSGNSDGNGYGNFEYAVPSSYYSLCTKNLAEFG